MTEIGEPLGDKQRVSLRDVWPLETDFSRWLGRNIGILNEQVNWEIDPESVRLEEPKGALRVDLLVEATERETGERFPVVIENQLEMTDGSHLAGVMSYAVAFEAKGAIWIAGDVSHEYVDVMQWLNEKAEIDAYLFRVETIRIDKSRPVPILTKVVGPSRFSHTGRHGGDPKRNQQVRDWWGLALPELADVHVAWRSLRPTAHQYPGVPIPGAPKPLNWYVNVNPHTSTIGIKISGGTKDEGDYYFDQLHERRDKIHEAFDQPLVWDPRTYSYGTRWVTCRIREPGGFADAPDVQTKVAAAIADAMKRLVTATESVARGIREFQPPLADAADEAQDES